LNKIFKFGLFNSNNTKNAFFFFFFFFFLISNSKLDAKYSSLFGNNKAIRIRLNQEKQIEGNTHHHSFCGTSIAIIELV